MDALVSYDVDGSIATISMDDGKVNVCLLYTSRCV